MRQKSCTSCVHFPLNVHHEPCVSCDQSNWVSKSSRVFDAFVWDATNRGEAPTSGDELAHLRGWLAKRLKCEPTTESVKDALCGLRAVSEGSRARSTFLNQRLEYVSATNARHLAMLIRVRLWCEEMGEVVEIDADPLPHLKAVYGRRHD